MTWARLDDRFHENRKIKRLWYSEPAALGLHVMALTYCAGNETDGLVDLDFVREKAQQVKDRERMLSALIESGLWVQEDAGWRIHDYLDFNPSHSALDEKREADAERKRRGRKTQSDNRPSGVRPESNGRPGGIREDSLRTTPRVRAESSGPDPTRPLTPPLPPQGGRSRDRDRYETEVKTFAAGLLPDVSPSDALSAVKSVLGALRSEDAEALTADEIRRRAVEWLPGLSDEQRDRIRDLGEQAVQINAGAEAS